jgi:hypothetical protein
VILVDTGPLVALFDPRDGDHPRCREALEGIREPIVTTVPVLTEAFHLLTPASRGAVALQRFVLEGGLGVWFLADASVLRAFDLMRRYADHPMDLADASLVAAAEALRCTTVFTIDRSDLATYRARIGRSWRRFVTLG